MRFVLGCNINGMILLTMLCVSLGEKKYEL